MPIRSFEWPRGFPNVAAWQQELLDSGNSLIEWSVLFLFHLDCHSCYGSMENPWPLYIWIQECVRMLWWSHGWAMFVYGNQLYGTRYQKLTGLLHNTPTLQGLTLPIDPSIPTIPLAGKVLWKGEWQFRTKLAEPYPPTMAQAYADLMVKALDWRKLALARGLPMPRASREHDAYMKHLGYDDGNMVPWFECPDQCSPLVPSGAGVPKGLTEVEHVAWARSQDHVLSYFLIARSLGM